MNKDSIYRIIGYNGEYNLKVKKALKRLLKENHPDCGGDVEIFKIINEVKKELESNKVSYSIKKDEKVANFKDEIDYDYCAKKLKDKQRELNYYNEKIEEIKKNIISLNEKYQSIYNKSVSEREYLVNNTSSGEKLKTIKRNALFLLAIALICFVIALIKKSIAIFIIFGIICFSLIMIVSQYFNTVHKIIKNNENNLHKYIKITSRLTNITDQREKLDLKKWQLEQEKKKIENDMRFYNNLLSRK